MKLLSRALQGAPLPTRFSDLVDSARLINDVWRRTNGHLMKQMSGEQWALDYATVQIDVGRQVGKTMYILDNATDDCLIVCASRIQADHMRQGIQHRGKLTLVVDPISAAVVTQPSTGIRFRTVFVDDATWQTQFTLDAVYAAASTGDIDQQFVLLG